MKTDNPFPRPRLVQPAVTHDARSESAAWIEDVVGPFVFDELVRNPQIPLMPEVARQVMALSQDPSFPIRKVADALRRDPALCALLLKAANSAVQGVAKPIGTIPDGVLRLGAQGLRKLIYQASAARILVVRGRPEVTTRLQTRAVAVAIASGQVAATYGTDAEAGFVAGLLHDVGQAIVYGVCVARTAPPELRDPDRLDAAVFALHERVGAAVATNWGLPPGATTAIGHHHHPERASTGSLMAYVVAAAVRLCDAVGICAELRRENLHEDPVFMKLGIGRDRIEALKFTFQEELSQQAA